MFKKKYLIILLFLIIAISAVSTVSAENATATDDLLSEDVADIENNNEKAVTDEQQKDILTSEETFADDILASEKTDENILTAGENQENTILSKKSNDETTLTKQITNKEVLSDDDDLETLKVTFIKQTGKYANDKKVYFKVTHVDTGRRVAHAEINYDVYKSNGARETYGYATTNSNGIGVITFSENLEHAGTFKIKADLFNWDTSKYGKTIYDQKATKIVKIYKNRLKIKVHRLTAFYKSGKKFKIKVLDKYNRRVANVLLKVKVYTGHRHKTLYLKTNSKGIAKYEGVSKLRAGKHKIRISIDDARYRGKSVSSYIKVQKKVKIYTKNRIVKIGGVLIVLVKDRVTKKLTNGIKVKLRLLGQPKTINLVTGYDSDSKKNGVVGLATNMLSVGTHKFKVIVNTDKYRGSANAKLVIPQSGKLYKNWVLIFTNGKAYTKVQ